MSIFRLTLLILVVIVYSQKVHQYLQNDNANPNNKLLRTNQNIGKVNQQEVKLSELQHKETNSKQQSHLKQNKFSAKLKNDESKKNLSNVNKNQSENKSSERKSAKISLAFDKKELLINSPLNFSSKILKTYKSSQVIYRQAHQIKNIKKDNKFYCVKQFQMNIQPPTTQLVKIEEGEQLVETQYGFNILIDQMDGLVSQVIKKTGTWEPQNIILIGNIIKPNNNILNLGSHIGLEAILMGKIIGPLGRIFIFEPYEVSNRIVTKNIQLNGMKNNTKIYKLGASDQRSTGTITIIPQNTGASYILPNQMVKNTKRQTFEVQLDTVDSVLPTDISIDFALIDVQLMQVAALRGMKELIKRSPNLIIMCEWQYRRNINSNSNQTLQLLNFMISEGYGMYQYYPKKNNVECQLGNFVEYQFPASLFIINQLDIFFIPKKHKILKIL